MRSARLTPALRNLKSASKNLGVITEITSALSQLKTIEKPGGLIKAVDSLKELPGLMEKFDAKAFENLKRVSEELAQSLEPLAQKMRDVADGYSAFSKIQNTFGKSASTVTRSSTKVKNVLSSVINVLKKGVRHVINFTRNLKQGFSKSLGKQIDGLKSKIKQITLSLLGTRTIFTMTRKAISEYQAFDQTLQKFSQNIWRAFGAQLAPVVEYVMELFKQFVRVIYSFVYAITGIDLIARANAKAMASWGKDAKDTLGSLQKFDDLNVVEFDKGKGDDNQLIEMDKIDLSPIQKIVDWVKQMKKEIQDALDTGRWYNVGVVFADGINDGISFLLTNFSAIENGLFEIVEDFGDALNGVIVTTKWGEISKLVSKSLAILPKTITTLLRKIKWDSAGEGLKSAIENFDITLKIKATAEMWGEVIDGLKTALARVDWGIVGKNISVAITTWLSGIGNNLAKIDFKAIGENLRTVLSNIEWGDIFSGFGIAFYEVFSGIGEFLQGLFDTDIDVEKLAGIATAIGVLVGGIVLLNKATSKTKAVKTLTGIGDGVKSLLSGLGKAAGTIALLGGLALVLQSLSDVLTSFSQTGLSAGEGVGLLAGLFASIAAGMLGLQIAFNAMDWEAMAAGLVMFAGLAVTFATLSSLLDSITATGFTAGETMGVLAVVVGSVIALMAAMTIAAMALQNPMAMAGVAVVVAAISATLLILEKTLPKILDASAKFINNIGPFVIDLVTIIGELIDDIINSLGKVLPPIIDSLGRLFEKVLGGIEGIIKSLGKTIVDIMNTAASLVERVLKAILRFINELGPAINTFVDNAIVAVTKLINFVVSSIEYLINTAIIKPINSLIKKINNNAIAEKLGWQLDTLKSVSVERFAPKLATGTNEIPYEGLYHLHPGEAVVPKKYNPALGNGGSEEMNAKMDTLIELMSNMNFTNIVNVGNKKLYEGQQAFNKTQQNKYGTINLY